MDGQLLAIGLFQFGHAMELTGLLIAQAQGTVLLDARDRHRHLVAHRDGQLTLRVAQGGGVHDALGLAAQIDKDLVLGDGHHPALDLIAGLGALLGGRFMGLVELGQEGREIVGVVHGRVCGCGG